MLSRAYAEWRILAWLLFAGTLQPVLSNAGAGRLRQVAMSERGLPRSAPKFRSWLQDAAGDTLRRLSSSSYQTCAAALDGQYSPWVITCGGPSAQCSSPYCPLGFTADDASDQCTIAPSGAPSNVYWLTRLCVPWTVEYLLVGPTSWSVDDPYPVIAQALGQDGLISIQEVRPVILSLDDFTGAIRTWDIPISAGQGSTNISQTVAQVVTLALQGFNYSSDVDFPTFNVTFVPGATTLYRFRDDTLTGSVDDAIDVQVEASDQYGNIATAEQRGLVVDWTLNTNSSLGDSDTADFTDGIGTVAMRTTIPGTYTVGMVSATHPTADISDSMVVTFTVGAVTKYVFQHRRDTWAVGVGVDVEVFVNATDQYGNIVTTENRDVTVVTTGGSGAGLVDIVNGQGSVTMSHDVAEAVTLSLDDTEGTGLDVSDSLTLIFGPGVLVSIGLAAPQTSGTVDAPLEVRVRALDGFENVVTDEDRAVRLVVGSSCTASPAQVYFVNGIGTSDVSCTVPGTMTITLEDVPAPDTTGVDLTDMLNLTFGPGIPAGIALQAPVSGIAGEIVPLDVVTVDQYGNEASTGDPAVTVGATGSAVVSNAGVAQLSDGIASLTVANTVAESVTLYTEDTFSTGLNLSYTATIQFLPAAAAGYVFTTAPGTTFVAGETSTVYVGVQDVYGNNVTAEQRDVEVTVPDGVTGGGLVAITNGAGSTTISYTVAEDVVLSLQDPMNTSLDVSDTVEVTFIGAAARSIVFASGTLNGTVDNPIAVHVEARDRWDNLARSENSAVSVIVPDSNALVAPVVVSLTSGRGTTFVSSTLAIAVDLTLEDSNDTGLDVSSDASLQFGPGAPAQAGISAPLTVTAGEWANISLLALDQYGNEAGRGDFVLAMMASGSATVPNNGLTVMENGVATSTMRSFVAEVVVLTVGDTSNTLTRSRNATVSVEAASAVAFGFESTRVSATVDDPAMVVVNALDEYGNVDTNFEQDVSVNSTQGRALVSITMGTGRASLSSTVVQAISLNLIDSEGTGLMSHSLLGVCDVRFAAGVAENLEVLPGGGSVDGPVIVGVQATDQYGNPTQQGLGSRRVRRRLTDDDDQMSIQVIVVGVNVLGGGVVDVVRGYGETLVSTTVAQTVQVSLRDDQGLGLDVASIASFIITPGAPVRAGLRLPLSAVVGTAVPVVVEPRDQYNNIALTGPMLTVLANRAAVVSGGLDNAGRVDLTTGSVTVTVNNTRAQSVLVSMTDSSDSSFGVTETQTLEFRAGAAAQLSFEEAEMTTTVDAPASVGVQALDVYGNRADSFEGSVTVYKVDNPGEAVLASLSEGEGLALVPHRVVAMVELRLTDTANTGLDVTSATTNITFEAGLAVTVDLFAIGSTVVSVQDYVQIGMTARDAFGNVATSPVTLQVVTTGAALVTGGSGLDLVAGQGTARITNRLAEQVTVSLRDYLGVGLTFGQSLSLAFEAGPLYNFVNARTDNVANFIFQTGTVARWLTTASDELGNIVTDYPVLQLAALIDPKPPSWEDAEDGLTTWILYDGEGNFPGLQEAVAGVFTITFVSAEERSSTGRRLTSDAVLSQAISRTQSFQIEFRVDTIPPTWNDIDITITGGDITIDVIGLSEPGYIWCMAVPAGTPSAQTPATTSDDLVFLALRGNELGVTGFRGSVGPVEAGTHQIVLTSLDIGEQYLIRCIAADDTGNIMPGEAVSSSELNVTVPATEVPEDSSESDGETDGMLFLLAGVGICVVCCCVPLFFLAGFFCWRRHQKKQQSAKIAPSPETTEPKAMNEALNDPSKPFNDSGAVEELLLEQQLLQDMGEDNELLREALEMQQELMDELQKRGLGEDMDGFDDADSDFSAASDASRLLRDVQTFLRKDASARSASVIDADASLLPDLPLTLSAEDEERLDALAYLGKKDGNWDSKIARFDQLWNAAEGEIWAGALPIVRSEQQDIREKISATMAALDAAKKAVASHPETYEMTILDSLSEEEMRFQKETDGHLKLLHELSVEWPDEDAHLRAAIVEEWTPKIAAAPKKDERTQLRQDAVNSLRKMSDDREEALEVELHKLEQTGATAMEDVREEQAKMWRGACGKIETEAADLRKEIGNLKQELARLTWEAEKSALEAVLRLRGQIRDAAVERDTQKELDELDMQHTEQRAAIMEACKGDWEGADFERERALTVLSRAWQAARKVALDEKARRQRHWHEIVEERGRDRLKALQHRLADEERRLHDEDARVEENATDDEARRRTVLILGAAHRAEAAMLYVSAAVRRSRILMGLQATAADTVAEERLPRKGRDVTDSTGTSTTDAMGKTSQRWQAARRRVADELSDAVGLVSNSLTEHGQRQRALLAQTQRREAFLASQPEGDDEKREDLLDALEENMRREIRGTRWEFQRDSAQGMITSANGGGKETELGKRLASVARDSDLLTKEDEIGERYDRLRALVLGGGQAGEEEAKACAEAQQEAKELERQAAKLRAEAAKDYEDFGEEIPDSRPTTPAPDQAMLDELERLKAQLQAEIEAEQKKLEELRKARQKRRESAMQSARELQEQGKFQEAMEVMAEALRQDALEDAEAARLAAKGLSVGCGADADLCDQMENLDEAMRGAIAKAYSEDLARRRHREKQREGAQQQAKELLEQGKPASAAMEAMNKAIGDYEADAAAEAAELEEKRRRALDPNTDEEERKRLLAELAARDGRLGELTAEELERQRKRMEAMLAARRRKMQEAKVKAMELAVAGKGDEAMNVLAQAIQEDQDAETAAHAPFDHFMSEADRKKLRDQFEAAQDKINKQLMEDLERQRKAMEARRLARQQRREAAEAKARELQKEGKHDEAMEVLSNAVAEIMADEDAEAAEENERRKRALDPSLSDEERARLLAEFAAKDGKLGELTAEELERQRKRMEEMLARRRKKLQDAQARAKDMLAQGLGTEAVDAMIDAIRANEEEEKASTEKFDTFMSEAERARLRLELRDNKALVDEKLAAELAKQQKRLEARRNARGKRREMVEQQARELIAQGKDAEAMALLSKEMAAIQAEEDEDAAAEEELRKRAMDPSLDPAERARLLAQLAARDGKLGELTAEEIEAQRRRMEAMREARRKKREEAEARAKDLMAQGKSEQATEVMIEAMLQDEKAAREAWEAYTTFVYETERAAGRERAALDLERKDGLTQAERDRQRLALEARLAARQRKRDSAEQKAKELMAEGKHTEAMKVMEEAMKDIEASEAEDAAEEAKRFKKSAEKQLDLEKLRKEYLEGESKKSAAQAEEMEAKRRKMEEMKEARRKRREAAESEAKALQEQGKAEEAVNVLAAAMQSTDNSEATDVVVEEMRRTQSANFKINDGIDKVRDEIAGLTAEQRRKLEARKARQRMRHEEAEQKAKELLAEGKTAEALQVMLEAMKEDEADVAGEAEEVMSSAPLGKAWGTHSSGFGQLTKEQSEQFKAKIGVGLGIQIEATEKERDHQKQRLIDRRAERKNKREQAMREAETLEEKAAELHLQALRGEVKETQHQDQGEKEYDVIGDFQEAARRRHAAGAVANSVQKGQEVAAKRLVDTPAADEAKLQLKDGFAKEMEKCEAVLADEREVQRKKAQERLAERKKKREEQEASATAAGPKKSLGAMAALKVHKAVKQNLRPVLNIKNLQKRRRGKFLQEHRDLESRLKADHETELKALELRLRKEAEAELSKFKARVNAAEKKSDLTRTVTGERAGPITEVSAVKAQDDGQFSEAQNLIKKERTAQAFKVEARLAARRNRLAKQQQALELKHQQEEVRVELEQEKEKLQGKDIAKIKAKSLVRELNRVNGIIESLNKNRDDIAKTRSERPTTPLRESRTSGALHVPMLPPQASRIPSAPPPLVGSGFEDLPTPPLPHQHPPVPPAPPQPPETRPRTAESVGTLA